MSGQVSVTVSGMTGSGKTAIYMEIVAALKAIGVTVEHHDDRAFQSEMNMGSGDAHADLERYRPVVTMREVSLSRLSAGQSSRRSAPEINRHHIDGPYINFLDGTMRWLSPWERLLTKLGIWNAWTIEGARPRRLI